MAEESNNTRSSTDATNDEAHADETRTTSPAQVEDKLEEKERPYSVYSRREKWFLVWLVSFAGIFSPFTANIYFPVIPTLASAFHESIELINLTVTMYMVLQGLSPMVFGSMADYYGRRPIFALCLLVLCLSCVGLALVPTKDYWLLMVLRCIQASGSASTIALGAGVIGDIAVPSERGGFFGTYTLGPLLGPSIGPVIGGALSSGLGWRSIFWFLCISSGLACMVMILLLPETLRTIVGDGSVVPPRIYRPFFPIVSHTSHDPEANHTKPPKPRFKNPLLLFKNLDIVILLVFSGVVYAVFYAVTASIAALFSDVYPFLNDTTLGLCFLAIGGGTAIGSAATGRILDWDFQRVKRKHSATHDKEKQSGGHIERGDVEAEFPIEKARLRLMPHFMVILVGAGMGYGWCLERKVHIAAPLILSFLIGWFSFSVIIPTQTLILDLVPGQGSTVTACNNLVRCLLGALAVSVIDLILKRLGPGNTYVLLYGISVVFMPLLYGVMKLGPRYRKKRRAEADKRLMSTSS